MNTQKKNPTESSSGNARSERANLFNNKIIIPVCSNCNRIRLGDADPCKMESWITPHIDLDNSSVYKLSHGICPSCMEKLYGDYLEAC
ncbi:MAG: hypothetical protein P9L92_17150 [Candidatus Electryonea clarkiae]|nr:hypothetical protein [Candidatus Electryonea clarkiae]MDP8285635.1 hypothetical protein [Candidatus Electryonea clarkiae]